MITRQSVCNQTTNTCSVDIVFIPIFDDICWQQLTLCSPQDNTSIPSKHLPLLAIICPKQRLISHLCLQPTLAITHRKRWCDVCLCWYCLSIEWLIISTKTSIDTQFVVILFLAFCKQCKHNTTTTVIIINKQIHSSLSASQTLQTRVRRLSSD